MTPPQHNFGQGYKQINLLHRHDAGPAALCCARAQGICKPEAGDPIQPGLLPVGPPSPQNPVDWLCMRFTLSRLVAFCKTCRGTTMSFICFLGSMQGGASRVGEAGAAPTPEQGRL